MSGIKNEEPRPMQDMVLLAKLLQFSDSTLPVGAFAFSNGLESALQTEVVTNPESLHQFVNLVVRQAAHMDGIAFLHAHRAILAGDYEAVLAADHEVWDRRVGEEQQLMLARMGKKFAELSLKISDFPPLERWLKDIKSGATPGCFPIGQALALAHMGADEQQAFVVHQYGVASMILSAAVRLMRIDHLDTQRILFAAQARVEQDYEDVHRLGLDEMSSFAPVFDILVAHHTKTHVRLFMN
ncbi:urease accessory protein UreF [Brucella pseudogrignonensis]|uniref:urease accessory protein UreF n=1 Tax=Brucella pseudogrignonensis TaxID=419475 RepID=UPI0028B2C2FE|nr:urease accessory protein UreF [Brucella pseudogrignonensis]MDT6941040.1 urease accessory protein UreF [Brucella pseudogrignonensis]